MGPELGASIWDSGLEFGILGTELGAAIQDSGPGLGSSSNLESLPRTSKLQRGGSGPDLESRRSCEGG